MKSTKSFSKVKKKNNKTQQNWALIPHFVPGKTKKLGDGRVESSKKHPGFLILKGEVIDVFFSLIIRKMKFKNDFLKSKIATKRI